ncbi:MAG: hypothetical protein AAF645_29275, partial [Myxococcota bacterium]
PVAVVAVALEVQHRVNHVFEQARPGEGALLRDVPNASLLARSDEGLHARLQARRDRRRDGVLEARTLAVYDGGEE